MSINISITEKERDLLMICLDLRQDYSLKTGIFARYTGRERVTPDPMLQLPQEVKLVAKIEVLKRKLMANV